MHLLQIKLIPIASEYDVEWRNVNFDVYYDVTIALTLHVREFLPVQ